MTHRSGLALVAAVLAMPMLALAQPATEAAKAAAEPALRQLEAFRLDDYDTAYGFASEEIRQMFDRQAFERMVRSGYPEIARSSFASVAGAELGAGGQAYVTLKIRGANGRSVEAVYEMVREQGVWKINGVVTRPDAGLI